jgi:hypothetical protein
MASPINDYLGAHEDRIYNWSKGLRSISKQGINMIMLIKRCQKMMLKGWSASVLDFARAAWINTLIDDTF